MTENRLQPVWRPEASVVETSELRLFQKRIEAEYAIKLENYEALHQWSVNHLEDFWKSVWRYCRVTSDGDIETALDSKNSIIDAHWFPAAKLNLAENLLRFRDDKPALVSVKENGERQTLSYADLYIAVEKFAAGLVALEVCPGDRVGGVLPNTAEAVVAMLGTVSIGAIWTCCSPDFGVEGILDRFGQTKPKVVVGCEHYDYAGKTHSCIKKLRTVAERLPDLIALVVTAKSDSEIALAAKSTSFKTLTMDALCELEQRHLEFERLPFDHPAYILYSSGTTGKPKCIVHGGGGTLLQHLKSYVLHYNVKRDDVFFYYTTTGWTMWNILVSALATGCTVVLYDGSPFHPGAERLVDLIDVERISVFGVSAKYISGIENAGLIPDKTHGLASLRMILSTGSPLAKESYDYVYQCVKPSVCLGSICGGTDIISAFIEATYSLPVTAGFLQCKGLGMAVDIWNEDGQSVLNEKGDLVCTKPFPSRPIEFWNDEDKSRYKGAYFERFPGIWAQGDFGEQTSDGQFVIYGRSDAVLNPGGVRIGTAEIYRQVEQVTGVVDSVCVGQQWQGDVRVVLFVILADGQILDEALENEIRNKIRSNTTPRHVPSVILQVPDIPRTVSGKNVELAVREVIHGNEIKNTESLANPEALNIYRGLRSQLST